MNPLNGLSEYLDRIERRMRVLTVSRGAALTTGAALAFTVLGAVVKVRSAPAAVPQLFVAAARK